MIQVVIHFRPYFYGTKFILYTNHQPIKWLMTNDKHIGKLVCWRLFFTSMSSRLFTDPVLHIRTQILCHGNPSLPLKIFQKSGKTSIRFQQYIFYASNYFALLQCNLIKHPIVDIWEDLDTLKFFQHGEYPPQVTSSHRDCIQ